MISFDPSDIISLSTVLVALLAILQLLDAKADYRWPALNEKWPWHLHHDEKIIVPDARFFFTRRRIGGDIMDYQPYPTIAAYGVAGPFLALFGVRLFGLNSLGLRFAFILLSALSNLLCSIAIFKVAPGEIGILLSLAFLLNYRNFLLSRHAILENLLTGILMAIFCIYLGDGPFFLEYLPWIAFCAGATVLIKPNFVVYVYLLLFAIVACEKQSLSDIGGLCIWSLAGILCFEGIQALLLYHLGIVRWRYFNLFRALKQHSGADVRVLQQFRPDGIRIFNQYLELFCRWYGLLGDDSSKPRVWAVLYYLPLLFVAVFPVICGNQGRQITVFGVTLLFILLYLLASSRFHFYTKRAISLFPFTVILLGISSAAVFERSQIGLPLIESVLLIIAGILFAVYLATQITMAANGLAERSTDLVTACSDLQRALPSRSIVYAHCYAYRFLWQVPGIRLKSSDDQIMDNQMILDWAVKEGGEHVMLSGRGGAIRLPRDLALKHMHSSTTKEAESDLPDSYILFKILSPDVDQVAESTQLPLELKGYNDTPLFIPDNCADLLSNLPCASQRDTGGPAGTREAQELLMILKSLCHESDKELHALISNVKNQMILDWAIVDTAKFVWLSTQEGSLSPETLKSLNYISSCRRNCDQFCCQDEFILFEIDYGLAKASTPCGTSSHQTLLDTVYKCASRLKTIGKYDAARKIFLILERSQFHLWGVYFHLGELSLQLENRDTSLYYFTLCLKHNPNHIKARQYLETDLNSRQLRKDHCGVYGKIPGGS